MPICIPATSHCSVFSVFIIPFLGDFQLVKNFLKEYPCSACHDENFYKCSIQYLNTYAASLFLSLLIVIRLY
jgi:hypothetical protein